MEWISVKDKLPEIIIDNFSSGDFLITDGKNISIGSYEENYNCDGWHWYDEMYTVEEVTHYMPLPELPKKE
jgi:hypothetical protein